MATSPFQRAKVIAPAAGRLLSLETLRAQCEVVPIDGDSDAETHPDDALLLGLLDAAVAHAEEFTGRAINLQTFEVAFDKLPAAGAAITLPRPPLVEVISFSAQNDSDGELDPADYVVDDYGDAARLMPVTNWPTFAEATNNVRIRFRAGYQSEVDPDSDAQPLPGNIRQAVLLLVGHWYANREDATERAPTSIPEGFRALLRPMRVRLGFA